MSRYIDAHKLQEENKKAEFYAYAPEICEAVDAMIKNQSTADMQEVRHGRWRGYTSTAFHGMDKIGNPIYRDVNVWTCSECYRKTVIKENFCPNCGARMEENEDE